MAITKPTDNILWAESASPGDVADPSGKRAGGWQLNDALPYNNLNYLLRSTGRFGAFNADALGADSSELTLSAQHGRIELVADPANIGAGVYHIYRHVATGTNVLSQLQSDTLMAREGVVFLNEDRDPAPQARTRNVPLVRAAIRAQVNNTGSGWDAPVLLGSNAHNVTGATITATSPGFMQLSGVDLTGVVIDSVVVTCTQVRDGSNNILTPPFGLVAHGDIGPSNEIRIRPVFDDAGTWKHFFTDFPVGGRASFRVDFQVLVYGGVP